MLTWSGKTYQLFVIPDDNIKCESHDKQHAFQFGIKLQILQATGEYIC